MLWDIGYGVLGIGMALGIGDRALGIGYWILGTECWVLTRHNVLGLGSAQHPDLRPQSEIS